MTPETQKNMHQTLVRLGKRNMLNATNSVYQEFLRAKNCVQFHFPILLTYGESDKVGLVAKYNQHWANTVNAKLKVIKNASHNANYDNPLEFNYILEKYIKKRIK